MKVYKYKLELTEEQKLELPYRAKILSVEKQQGDIVLYALVNEGQNAKEVFKIFYT